MGRLIKLKKRRPAISEKMIYEFCKNSKDHYLNKVRHKDIRKQDVDEVCRCYSALYVHLNKWHPLLNKLRIEVKKRLNLQLKLFSE